MLAVLWVVVGLAALGWGVSMTAREALASARNRSNMARAAWRAEDCLARARAAIAEVLSGQVSDRAGHATSWSALDRVVSESPLVTYASCIVTVHAAGATLDINAADAEALRALFRALRLSEAQADSLTDALLDWRDADDIPRPLGAERTWYERRARDLPRNGPLADLRELGRIRGFPALSGLDSVAGVEPGRISLRHAPLAVLATLPGTTEELLARIAERRARGVDLGDLMTLGAELSKSARDSLEARYADAVRRTAVEPDAWIATSRSSVGVPAVTAVIEVRLVRAGARAAVVRRRTWWS